MSAALAAALRPAPSSKPGVVSGLAPCCHPVGAAGYRAMRIEAQAEWPLTLSTDRDPLLGFPGPVGCVGKQKRLETIFTIRVRLLAGLHRADERIELDAIGRLIALEEKVERLVAGEAVRARKLDRRL